MSGRKIGTNDDGGAPDRIQDAPERGGRRCVLFSSAVLQFAR
jgi:hypothetical protein